VSVSGDTAIVGQTNSPKGQGTAYVFTRSGTTWTQSQKLFAGDGAVDDKFGISLSLSGATALIGAPGATVNSFARQGAAYVFTESGGTFSQAQRIVAADGSLGTGVGDVRRIVRLGRCRGRAWARREGRRHTSKRWAAPMALRGPMGGRTLG
jgi:hypothetical protein